MTGNYAVPSVPQGTNEAVRVSMACLACAVLAIAWLLSAPVVFGAEDEQPLLSEEEFTAELPVVLTASRLAQPLDEAPAAVTIIDRQMIDASGARNLSEVFRLVPGFLVGFESGHAHVVTYHGLADKSSPRLQVLVDGRSVYLPSFGGVSWSDLPLVLDDVERIEVIRGPNAASYGANAFLATINIITRNSAADPGGFVRASAGSNHIRDGVLRAAGGEGNLHYRLTTGYQEDNGYAHVVDSRVIRQITGRLDRNGEHNDLEFQFGYNDGPRGVGQIGSLTDVPRNEEITSRFEQLRWRHRLDGGGDISLQYYHVHHEWDDRYQTQPIPIPIPPFSVVLPIALDVRSDRYDIELQHTLSPWSAVRVVWGMGARQDENLSPNYLGTPATVKDHLYRLFTNVEWRAMENLVVNAGAMYEKYDITGSDVSPRLAMNYHLQPGHTLRVAVSRADRQPVAFEEQSNERICADPACTYFDQLYLSSGHLRPERIDSSEIGYLGRLTPAFNVDLRLFRDQLFDLISDYKRPYPADLVNGKTFDFRNGGKAALFGTELQLQYQPRHETRVILALANTQIRSNDFDSFYSKSVPRNNLSLLALRDLSPAWQVSTAFYYQDKMQFIGGDPLGVLRRLDLRLARRFTVADGRGEVAIILQNVLGSQTAYSVETLNAQVGYCTLSFQFQ
jgi:iron complex outermembrane receptor protein